MSTWCHEKALLRHKHALAQIRSEKGCCPHVYISYVICTCVQCVCVHTNVLYLCAYVCMQCILICMWPTRHEQERKYACTLEGQLTGFRV